MKEGVKVSTTTFESDGKDGKPEFYARVGLGRVTFHVIGVQTHYLRMREGAYAVLHHEGGGLCSIASSGRGSMQRSVVVVGVSEEGGFRHCGKRSIRPYTSRALP